MKTMVSNLNSKLVCIKFKIERKSIKNGAREERRASIHKLEQEKNIAFHPKRDRSKSIPIINMNLRLKSLKEMKEDMLMKKSRVGDELIPQDFELKIPIMEYNFNDIGRKILLEPFKKFVTVEQPKRWLKHTKSADDYRSPQQ